MKPSGPFRKYARGLSLIELMIATTIGIFILAAIGSVYVGNRNTYRTSESISRVQDEARVAVMAIRRSLQHAGYFGRLDSPIVINGRLESGSDLPLISGDCAPGWAINLDQPVEARDSNGGNPYPSCLTGGLTRGLVIGTDLLTVRRADSAISDPTKSEYFGKIFLRADIQRGELFVADGNVPSGYDDPPLGEDRLLVTELYYITPHSYEEGDNIPMLRQLRLSDFGGTPALRTDRVAENVEQFQVQFGEDLDGDGEADQFVDPPNITPGRAVSVRFWLLVRSAIRESGFVDANTYVMGNTSYTPPADARAFRRTLITQTVDLRNL